LVPRPEPPFAVADQLVYAIRAGVPCFPETAPDCEPDWLSLGRAPAVQYGAVIPRLLARSVSPHAAVLLLALAACSSSSSTPPPDGATAAGICDGSAAVRLAIQVSGGGPALPGNTMLSENGWRFLLVDGTCTVWVLKAFGDALVREALSADAEAQLATALKLSTWDRIAPPTGSCPDAAGLSFRFDEQRLSSSSCDFARDSPWGQLAAAADEQLDGFAAAGEVWAGDLRYLVLQESTPTDSRPPVAWPLDTAVEPLALDADQAFGYRAGGSLRATGDEAAKLRVIRTTAAAATATYGVPYDFTRVMDARGGTYQLYIRDALPFEQDNGLVPPGVF